MTMNENSVKEIETLINENGVRVVEFLLAPESNSVWHHHTHVSEYCYCLVGHLSVEIEGSKTVILRPGEKCQIVVGIEHIVRNESRIPCRFLVVQGIGEYDFVEYKSAF
jgi:quercetin dioxygenase-like cupin family protein